MNKERLIGNILAFKKTVVFPLFPLNYERGLHSRGGVIFGLLPGQLIARDNDTFYREEVDNGNGL